MTTKPDNIPAVDDYLLPEGEEWKNLTTANLDIQGKLHVFLKDLLEWVGSQDIKGSNNEQSKRISQ